MKTWQVEDAKTRFSELLEACLTDGPQVVTRRGVETAVLMPVDEWRQLQRRSQPSLKELLLGNGPRLDARIPPRRSWRRRPPPALD
jgi:antitoxin Phd